MRKSGNSKSNPPRSFTGKEKVTVVAVSPTDYKAVGSSSGLVPQAAASYWRGSLQVACSLVC